MSEPGRATARPSGGRTAMTLAVLLLAACTSPRSATFPVTSEPPATTVRVATSTTQGMETAQVSTVTRGRDHFVRSCGSRIAIVDSGEHPEDLAILRIGPVAFFALDLDWTADLPEYFYEPTAGGAYEGIKFPTGIAGTAAGPVSVSISEEDRGTVGLVYDPARFRAMTLPATDHTVVFEVCPGVDAQFNGGFVVTEPTCVEVIVVDEGRNSPNEWTAAIPFGVPRHACP